MNDSLNVRFKAESWTYWKSFLKADNYSYKWSTIEHNSINTGTSENIISSNNSIPMWSISKNWKRGYVIKIRATEKFLQNKRSTCISRPELKIKKIIVYRWTFTKVSLKLRKVLWVIHNYIWCNRVLCNDGPSEKVLYKTWQNLSSLIENYIMEGVRSPTPEI